jgi:hypothetical protein
MGYEEAHFVDLGRPRAPSGDRPPYAADEGLHQCAPPPPAAPPGFGLASHTKPMSTKNSSADR